MDSNVTQEFPNQGRQLGIDLAKCLSISFMVIVHCLKQFGVDPSLPFYQYFDLIFGSILAAPVFMTAMGVGLAYSRRSSPSQFIFRGINILILGYLLEFVRVWPRYVIAGVNLDLDLLFTAVFINSLGGDILQFAGLALILFGLLRLAKLKDYWILAVGVALSLVTTFVPLLVSDQILLVNFVGLFAISTYKDMVTVAFPVLSWFIFVGFGYWYGNRLKNSHNTVKFHLICGGIGAVIAITGFTISSLYGFGAIGANDETAFYGMKIYDAIFCLGACVGFFALCHFISLISPKLLQKGYINMSNGLNLIYMIHWPMILYISLPLEYYGIFLPLWSVLLIGIGIIITATIAGVALKNHIKKKTGENPHSLWRYVNAG